MRPQPICRFFTNRLFLSLIHIFFDKLLVFRQWFFVGIEFIYSFRCIVVIFFSFEILPMAPGSCPPCPASVSYTHLDVYKRQGVTLSVIFRDKILRNQSGLSQRTWQADACLLYTSENGYITIFDGETFNGWRGYGKDRVPSKWTIEDGCICLLYTSRCV